MKEVYDLLLNFKKIAYEFYEWNNDDEIINIKKIPIIKVNSKTLIDFLNYDLIIKDNLLDIIKDKTEIFTNKGVKKIEYACILFNNDTTIAIKFNSSGNIIGRSKLLFEESDDLILSGLNLEIQNIIYDIISKIEYNNLFTRKEYKIANAIIKYIENTYEKKNYDELKYIYLECFNYEENDCKKIYEKLINSIKNVDYDIINKLSSLLKVLKK